MAEETKVPAAPKKAAAKKTAPKAKTAEATEATAPKKAPAKKATKKAAAPKVEAEVKAETKVEAKVEKKAEVKVEKAPVTQAIAVAKDVRVTPRKCRLVMDYVRGKDVDQALAELKILNKAGAEPVYKLIKSAAANATNNFHLNGEKLYVAEIQASDGVKMKRFMPRAKGSSSGMVKRTANLRVVVKERN